jgi:TRAP-type C4-dicarboxylate transport system permease small subunit
MSGEARLRAEAVLLRLSSGLSACFSVLITAALGVMVVVVLAAVAARYVFEVILIGPEEIARYMMTSIVFLGLPVLAHRFEHIRLTFVFEQLKSDRMRRRAEVVVLFIELSFLLIFTYASFNVVTEAWSRGQRSTGLEIPLWWVLLPIVVGSAAGALVTALRILLHWLTVPAVMKHDHRRDETGPEV